MKKGIKKFYIICAVVFAGGLLMATVGFFTGGIDSIDKMDEKYDWFHGGPGAIKTMYIGGTEVKPSDIEDFDSINIKGEADVIISTGNPADTNVKYGENYSRPKIYIKEGTLYIEATDVVDGGVINLTGKSGFPVVQIYCEAGKTLEAIDADMTYSDIEMEDIDVRNTSIDLDLGDCDIIGTFTGNTQITVDTGDVEIEGTMPEDRYMVEADVDSGDLSVGDKEIDDGYEIHYEGGTGSSKIKVKVDLGDVEIDLGERL